MKKGMFHKGMAAALAVSLTAGGGATFYGSDGSCRRYDGRARTDA